jgi:2-C-methyl-D-erythritol 2,4-cyclodiphosphate synthase
MAVGLGFDLHRLKAGGTLRLGGIQIAKGISAVAHSDGDALLHALIDALLGATGGGDIGERFPNSDPRWKGADSSTLLGQVWRPMARHWSIVNLDVVIHLERPRLGPWKPKIRTRLAALLATSEKQINVKAKTMEGLGPIGQGHAVGAHAIVELRKRSRVKRG